MVKNPLAKARDVDSSLAQEDPLQKEMAPHCSILAWEILWPGEHGGLQSVELPKGWTCCSD